MTMIEDLQGMTFQAESGGHTFEISGVDTDGNNITFSGTPAGVMLKPDNTDQALTCSVSGGKVYATLPAGCYDVPGRFGLTIFLTSDSQKTAIYAAVGIVAKTSSGVASSGTTASVVDLINAINAALANIPVTDTNLKAAMAPVYSNTALYAVGDYSWYEGVLKKCIVAITAAETYTSAHWTNADLGKDIGALKGAFSNMTLSDVSSFVENAVSEASGNRVIPKTLGKVVNLGSSTVDVTALVDRAGFACSVISCSPGDVFTITASGYGNYRSYAFVKSDGTTRIEASGSGVNLDEEIKIAPAQAAYLVINDSSDSASFYGTIVYDPNIAPPFDVGTAYNKGEYVSYGKKLYLLTEDHPVNTSWSDTSKVEVKLGNELITNVSNIMNELSVEDEFVRNAIWFASNNRPIAKIQGKVVNTGSTSVDVTDLVDRAGFSCSVVPCSAGDSFVITASGYGNYRSYAFVKSDGTRLEGAGSGVNLTKEIKIAPANTAYLVINDSSNSASFYGTMIDIKSLQMIVKQPTGNLYDAYSENIVSDKYINTNGAEADGTSYMISDYIPVVGSTRYYLLECVPTSTTVCAATYDESLNILSVKQFASDQYIDTPASAKWLRVTITKSYRYRAQVKTDNDSAFVPYRDVRYTRTNMIAPNYRPGGTYAKGRVVTEAGNIYKANQNNQDNSFTPAHWDIVGTVYDLISGSSAEDTAAVVFSKNAYSKTGSSVSASTSVELGYANITKNVIYELCCKFTATFDSVTVGQGATSTKYASWVTVDSTNITIYLELGDGNPRTSVFAHGLTISDFLNIRVETTDENTCYVEIQTNGGSYRTEISSQKQCRFYGNCYGQYYFKPTNAITEYSYSVVFKDATKPIWMFGDSYMSFTSDRWVYYLKGVNQFNNVLINAVGGLNSARAVYALGSLEGRPKFALWAIGMNDNSDTDINTPAEDWMTGVNTFLLWCSEHDCTPVFGTVPTTPDYEKDGQTIAGKYNEGKNKWIRDSGHRYIDFAKAYGADSTGNWYTGMLNTGTVSSPDYVHPTEHGAKAAFHRALADFPEIMGVL